MADLTLNEESAPDIASSENGTSLVNLQLPNKDGPLDNRVVSSQGVGSIDLPTEIMSRDAVQSAVSKGTVKEEQQPSNSPSLKEFEKYEHNLGLNNT